MKYLTAMAAMMAMSTASALAAGSHAGGHGDMAIGKPGGAANISRTVSIEMVETDDGSMLFEPASISVKEGETVRLKFANKGELEHEFVMDGHHEIMDHKALMEKFPEMEHDDPNAIRLAPGAEGEIIWQFTGSGNFEFACLIPGHYESGMKGKLVVKH